MSLMTRRVSIGAEQLDRLEHIGRAIDVYDSRADAETDDYRKILGVLIDHFEKSELSTKYTTDTEAAA